MPSIKKVTKASGAKAAGRKAKAGDMVPNYVLQDNQDGSFDVFGVDATGAQTDISGVASLDPPPTSSDPATLTVDPPSGMHVACHGLKPGAVQVTVTATWSDGSVGPFTITVPCDVTTGPATGLDVKFGTPTIR
jgi:hypothetical protein